MVITKSISRFARNTVTLLETVRELKTLGTDVFFEEQNIHSISADGELMLTILASYAQEESLSASENQKWRIKKNFEEGKPWNCTMAAFPEDVPGLSGIGGPELVAYISGRTDLAAAKAAWLTATRAYAKRQMTWFRKEADVTWFSPGEHQAMRPNACWTAPGTRPPRWCAKPNSRP